LRFGHRPLLGLPVLPGVRVGEMRLMSGVAPTRLTADGSRRPIGGAVAVGPQPAAWQVLDARARGTAFVALPFRSVLNSPEQTGMDFWSINPYVGCEFGCSYCYARFAHQYVVERAGARGGPPAGSWHDDDFERRIFVKAGAADVLALTLRPRRLGGHAIAIGTATDPYQPAERTFRITRQILERLAQMHGLQVGIVTKSPLVARDVDVLRRLAERSELTIHLSLITVDAPLLRRLEARSPAPGARLRALEKLAQAGLNAGLMIAPILPGITDDVPHLEALIQAARDAGARFAGTIPLRMYGGVRRRFLPLVAAEFPHLLAKYQRAYAAGGELSPVYVAALKGRVTRLRRRIGVPAAPTTGAHGSRLTADGEHAAQHQLSLGEAVGH
jgi:DNA repair photolyase